MTEERRVTYNDLCKALDDKGIRLQMHISRCKNAESFIVRAIQEKYNVPQDFMRSRERRQSPVDNEGYYYFEIEITVPEDDRHRHKRKTFTLFFSVKPKEDIHSCDVLLLDSDGGCSLQKCTLSMDDHTDAAVPILDRAFLLLLEEVTANPYSDS